MADHPLVSVIVPCYKQAQYLPEAIDSVLAQTYPGVECVVVNDGSPDDTEAVARRYGDRVRYVARPNGGISAARNSGVAFARGDYLKFLDSDDLLTAHLHAEVESLRQSRAEIAVSGWMEQAADGTSRTFEASVFDAITDALKTGDEVRLTGFGVFVVANRAAGKGRNPQTGAEIEIKASRQPKFRAGKQLKDALNESA